MFSLQSVLSKQDFVKNLPAVTVIVCAVIIALAFIVGAVKGFRRIGWGGITWLIAGVGFLVANKYLNEKNPIAKIDFIEEKGAFVAGCVSAVTIAIACILIALIIKGLFSAAFRPRKKLVKDSRAFKYDYDDNDEFDEGFEAGFEDDYDDNDEDGYVMVKKGYNKPGFFGRIFGGVICAVNAAIVLAVILSVVLFVIDGTKLRTGLTGHVFDVKITNTFYDIVSKYALDFVSFGVIIGVAALGYKKGFLSSLRAIIVGAGTVAAIVLCFWLPFTEYTQEWHLLGKLVERCAALFDGLDGKLPEIIGKIVAGAGMCVVAILLIVLLNFVLKKLANAISNVTALRVVDGWLAVVFYIFLGVVACGAIWAIFSALDYYGVLYIRDVLSEDSIFSNDIYMSLREHLWPVLEKLKIEV